MWLIRLWSFAVYVLLVVMLVVDVTFDIVLHVGDGQTTDGQVITKISRVFLAHDPPLRGLCARWSSAIPGPSNGSFQPTHKARIENN